MLCTLSAHHRRGAIISAAYTTLECHVQVQFDADYEQGPAQAPPVMFCTDDGHLCRADWAARADTALMHVQPNAQQTASNSTPEVSTLLSEASSVNGFDIDGSEIVAVVEQECMCYIKRRSQTF